MEHPRQNLTIWDIVWTFTLHFNHCSLHAHIRGWSALDWKAILSTTLVLFVQLSVSVVCVYIRRADITFVTSTCISLTTTGSLVPTSDRRLVFCLYMTVRGDRNMCSLRGRSGAARTLNSIPASLFAVKEVFHAGLLLITTTNNDNHNNNNNYKSGNCDALQLEAARRPACPRLQLRCRWYTRVQIQHFHNLREAAVHPHTKFQRNRTIRAELLMILIIIE